MAPLSLPTANESPSIWTTKITRETKSQMPMPMPIPMLMPMPMPMPTPTFHAPHASVSGLSPKRRLEALPERRDSFVGDSLSDAVQGTVVLHLATAAELQPRFGGVDRQRDDVSKHRREAAVQQAFQNRRVLHGEVFWWSW